MNRVKVLKGAAKKGCFTEDDLKMFGGNPKIFPMGWGNIKVEDGFRWFEADVTFDEAPKLVKKAYKFGIIAKPEEKAVEEGVKTFRMRFTFPPAKIRGVENGIL